MNNLKLKLDNRELLSSEEVEYLISEFEIDNTVSDYRRWYHLIVSIIQVDNDFYELTYKRGNTEYQMNEYEEQVAKKVKKIKKMVEVEEWEYIK